MTIRTHPSGHQTGEDVDDLITWVKDLPHGPKVTHTVLATCAAPHHGADRPAWFYVEADPSTGVARRRCVACGTVADTLDSGDHWTFPHGLSCATCAQSIMEVVIGLHAEASDGGVEVVDWAVVAVRCVDCGRLNGATDLHVPALPVDEATARV